MRAVSAKRAAQLREYRTRRDVFLAAHPLCERCSVNRASEVHHRRGRRGADLLVEDWWAALCHRCHVYVTVNPAEALAEGSSLRRNSA